MVAIWVGAWAVESQTTQSTNRPADFDPTNPNNYPKISSISIEILGVPNIGQVYMLEGIENESSPQYDPKNKTWNLAQNAITSYPHLVLHGVFHRLMRDWRDEVNSGTVTKREIRLHVLDSTNRQVLLVRFYNAWPVKFSIPPFSVDGSTRYMERMEFVYDYFTITNA